MVGLADHVASLDVDLIDPGQIESDPPPRAGSLQRLFVALHPSNASLEAVGVDHCGIVDPDRPVEQRAGHDRACTARGEGPIHPESGTPDVSHIEATYEALEPICECLDTLSGGAGDRDDLCFLECRPHQLIGHLQ